MTNDPDTLKVLEEIRDAIKDNGAFAKQVFERQQANVQKLLKRVVFIIIAFLVLSLLLQIMR